MTFNRRGGGNLSRSAQRIRGEVFAALEQGGRNIAADYAKRINDGPKSGIVYGNKHYTHGQYSAAKIDHQASAPGQAPADESGRLEQSATSIGHRERMVVEAGSATPYAAVLELGNHAGTLEPRPALSPAFHEEVPRVLVAVTAAVRRGVRP